MRDIMKLGFALLCASLFVTLVVGLTVNIWFPAGDPPTSTGSVYHRLYHKEYEHGARAYRLKVSADANPYKGELGTTKQSVAWLDGYMDAKELDK